MAQNNSVQLLGHLGADPKSHDKNGKVFIVLNVATQDSYPTEEKGETKWHERETVWHDVLVFRPTAAHFARELKKGDRVRISGEISYRPFKDAEGYTRKQATIVATYIEKVHYEKQEVLIPYDYAKEVDDALANGGE